MDDGLEGLFTNVEYVALLHSVHLFQLHDVRRKKTQDVASGYASHSITLLISSCRYVTRNFTFGQHSLQLQLLDTASSEHPDPQTSHPSLQATYILNSSCCSHFTADYDLTGQVLWPAAKLLARYLAENPEVFQHRTTACEIGSGLGLTGLLCAQYCNIVLTDHNPVVMNVLKANAALNQGQHSTRYSSLQP